MPTSADICAFFFEAGADYRYTCKICNGARKQALLQPAWHQTPRGKLDPQTPHKHAEYLFEVLEGDNKELTTFDYATHGIIVSTQLVEEDPSSETCGMRLLASYVKNGGDLARLDKTCVGEMPRFNWKISTDYMYGILGTDEPYDGAYNEILSTGTDNSSG
ncbi:hypothetical protein PInf_022932 [Phytophthora infestans]|nr:hypothetical protein PInf_022932 [Phytophthora infestans]